MRDYLHTMRRRGRHFYGVHGALVMVVNSLSPRSYKVVMGVLVVSVLIVIAVLARAMDLTLLRSTPRQSKTWTWSCEQQVCERVPASTLSTWTSLSHCSATCGDKGPPLWPWPTGHTSFGKKSAVFHLHDVNFKIHRGIDGVNNFLLKEAFSIFKSNLEAMVPEEDRKSALLPSDVTLKVSVFLRGDSEVYLSLNTSEFYHLEMKKKSGNILVAEIVALTFFGARNALETLSQLIWWDVDEKSLGAFRILKNASISDAPRFAYRGVMIDVARNFMPIPTLQATIIGMSASKLNTLHLHLTDSQSFPFESSRYPQMSRQGAYSGRQIYTAAELETLTEFARVRGVRILPELDAPSHAAAGWQWGEAAGLGTLAVCVDRQPWREYCGEPPCGQLNPINNNTYVVLGGLYKDLVDISKVTDMFHIGGDEVNMQCWADEVANNPGSFTREQFYEMLGDFHRRAYDELQTVKKIENVIVWSSSGEGADYVKTFPPEKYIVEEWGASHWQDTIEHLRLNYRVIIAHVNAWYLDCGFGSWIPGVPESCGPVSSWQQVYEHRPWVAYPHHLDQILGGEACLWSEHVDELSLEQKVWPRAAALAERLWSDRNELDIRELTARMAVHRERLVARGVKADVIWPRWCDENPNEC